MTSKNMSIVFGPTLLRPLVETQETLLGHAESVTQFLQLVIEKHSKLLSDDNMIGFVPTLTVTPHLSHEVPSTFEPSKTLGKKKTTKSPASVPKKTHAAGPKERGSSSLPPIAISFQASPDDRTELHKLFNHMQTESKTWSHSKALLAYKEIILSIKLAARCTKCGKISAEIDPSFCAGCGFNLKGTFFDSSRSTPPVTVVIEAAQTPNTP
eukprot:TRINITY_DN3793_c0_g2_i7.p2 TRINITY_DN3793_c0_g2~~TRINITY_DN3793_c0_g2_i7.p2  ORF type:complete len:211 (+),score=42.55 TRINITY_DN3793_c0_g2_i7:1352-1984(+)